MNRQDGFPRSSGDDKLNERAATRLNDQCRSVTEQLSLFLYGELSFDQEEMVQQHLDSCCACRAQLEAERFWHRQMDEREVEPGRELLDQCRRRLRLRLSAQRQRPSLLDRITSLLLPPSSAWRAAGAALAGAALLTVGFVSGQHAGASRAERTDANQLPITRLAQEPVASRVRYVEPDGSGDVRILVEEVRQRVLRGGMGDARIRNLLLTAATEAVDPGVRVETVDLLRAWEESDEVRAALLEALEHDPNAGVRLKALEGLRRSARSEDTRRALTNVLLKDENPGIRIKAIDLLTETSEPALEGLLRQLLEQEQNSYIRLKCQQALNDLNVERY